MKNANHKNTSEYSISYDPDLLLDLFNVPPYVRDLLEQLHPGRLKENDKTIQKLLKLIVRFPGVPQLKSLLTLAYMNAGKSKKASESNRWIVKEHHDWVFGLINMVNECVDTGTLEEVPVLLGEKMDLGELYPERDEFQIFEFTGFQLCVINYLCEINDTEAARSRHHLMHELAPDHPDTILALNLIEEREAFWENEPAILDEDGQPIIPTFLHKEIEWLYTEDLDIPDNMVLGILALPYETLVNDLEMVLRDAMDRFDYYYYLAEDEELESYEILFPFHAITLLGELRAGGSLPLVLDFLAQDRDTLDFWLGDIITEGLWESLYFMGNRELEQLADFIINPVPDIFARIMASTMISRLAVYQPDRRADVVNWYRKVLDHFIADKIRGDDPDEVFITMIAWDLIMCSLDELSPYLTRLFELDMFEKDEIDSLEEVLSEIKGPVNSFILKPREDVLSRYSRLRELFG